MEELIALQKLEQLDPQYSQESREQIFFNFDWTDSKLEAEARKTVEDLLVEFHDTFARQRFDIGINFDFKVKQTPIDESPAHSQRPPSSINLKEDVRVEVALLRKNGIVTTLPFSKYASPIVAQRKPNGKLCPLVDLNKNNLLISDDYISKYHPVSTLTDAAQHKTGKHLLCKLDCSQAYHCIQMAYQRVVETPAFKLTYRRLAQVLSRLISKD